MKRLKEFDAASNLALFMAIFALSGFILVFPFHVEEHWDLQKHWKLFVFWIMVSVTAMFVGTTAWLRNQSSEGDASNSSRALSAVLISVVTIWYANMKEHPRHLQDRVSFSGERHW